MHEFHITKANGEQVPYSEQKLILSLRKAGATNSQIELILAQIKPQLYDSIPSKLIYKMAFGLLKKEERSLAAKYNLKKAIMELGPSGYPFEKYVAEILRFQGYSVQIGQIVKGHCINHEIDVIAVKQSKQLMIECKYHNHTGIICDVKIPLYIQSRFLDVKRSWENDLALREISFQGMVVTNTRFSDDAIQFGTCMGLKLLGWNYPIGNGLREQIDHLALYPITCLTSLNKQEKGKLLDAKIVLCQEVLSDINWLTRIGIPEGRHKKIVDELVQLCAVNRSALDLQLE